VKKLFFGISVILLLLMALTACSPQPANDNPAAADVAEITALVEGFGKKLQTVSLLAPADVLKQSIGENYREYIAPELLDKWQNDPQKAPGREVSSPWPDRIEVLSVEKLPESGYTVKGKIIEITSVESVNGGVAAERPITLQVGKNAQGRWQITEVAIDSPNTNISEKTSAGTGSATPVSAAPGSAVPLEKQDIINDLISHPELIPYDGVLGGKMGFYYPDEIRVLTDRWVLAGFDDGHINGYMLLSYSIDNGKISWKVIDSYLDGE